MSIARRMTRWVLGILGLVGLALLGWSGHAQAHMYVTGQFGGTFPSSLSNITDVGGSFEPGTTATDLSLRKSIMYGGKVGYVLTDWLAVETEAYNSTPHLKQQGQTFNEPTFGPFQWTKAGTFRVTTWAFNAVGRLPVTEKVVVHAGVGPGIFFSHMKATDEHPQSSTRVGLNTQLGANYFLTKAVSLSLEWKFNHVRFGYPSFGTTEGFHATYNAHHVVFGISYWIPD